MDSPSVPLEIAAEHYRDGMLRGRTYGKTEFQDKAVKLLAELSNTGPFDQNVLLGIKVAMRAVKDLKID
jgi:hypothetical protein